jgi:hypothetical protein
METIEPNTDKLAKKKIIGLFYLLIRDHMPFGELTQMLRQSIEPITIDTTYTNKYILQAAEDLYNRFIG